ncbi:MAG: trypsin-like peptidase domain-containing protein [Acholeplasmataceae bacterium]|nr:trypsin-like peptidase domain-containing protein [Acholeplasmataceae bacterium]
MRKYFIILFFILISFSLSSCGDIKTYEDLYLEYETHLTENTQIYQDRIDYFNYVANISTHGIVFVEKIVYANIGSSSGSGVIFHEDELYYYVLTNNHVIHTNPEDITTYIISDYLGNEYTAVLIAGDRDYDLAILRFTKKDSDLEVIHTAQSNAIALAELTIIGYPGAQINAITMGKVIEYGTAAIDNIDTEIINVNFDILVSEAPVRSGSSGSAVINSDFELIGIVFAGLFSDYKFTSEYAYILPIEKILEFLDDNEFHLGGEIS